SSPTTGSDSLIAYTYDGIGGVPVVSQITPNTGAQSGGTKVTITGNNFLLGLNANVTGVMIGSNPLLNMVVVNNTTLTGTIPAGSPGVAPVVASSPSGASNANITFNYTLAFLVQSLDPNQGPIAGGGRSVTVTGQNFSAATVKEVDFNGAPGTSLNVLSSTQLTVIPPS